MTASTSRRMLLPALVFLACASLSAAGGGALAALCLVPAGLAIEAARGGESKDSAGGSHNA
ncbi:hypothetical protein [Congregibacter sp.]|uniref:hypothetical protein n=1 Tax=Congregibacter sp. TaxID=2744308 RepID=UPI00385E397D